VKQKLTLVTMLVLAAILIATPVLAAGSSHSMDVAKQGPRKKPTRISMTGTITAWSIDRTKIYLLVQKTNKPFIGLKNREVWVIIDENTLCVEWLDGNKSKKIDCGSLDPRNKVSIIATVVDRINWPWTFAASRVQLKQPRIQIPE
jgi:hypothetical protein